MKEITMIHNLFYYIKGLFMNKESVHDKEIAKMLVNNYCFCYYNAPYKIVIVYNDYDKSYTITNMNCLYSMDKDSVIKVFKNIKEINKFISKHV